MQEYLGIRKFGVLLLSFFVIMVLLPPMGASAAVTVTSGGTVSNPSFAADGNTATSSKQTSLNAYVQVNFGGVIEDNQVSVRMVGHSSTMANNYQYCAYDINGAVLRACPPSGTNDGYIQNSTATRTFTVPAGTASFRLVFTGGYEINVYEITANVPPTDYSGGFADGKTMLYSVNFFQDFGSTTLLTDNNDSTGESITNSPYTTAGRKVHLDRRANITSYRLKSSGFSYTLYFFENDGSQQGKLVGSRSSSIGNGELVTIPQVSNVDTVVIASRATSGTHTISEFNVYGTLMPDTTPPSTPTGLSVLPGDTRVDLSWDANSETDLEGYNVYLNGVKQNSTPIKTANHRLTSLANGTQYSVTISAVDDSGNESPLTAPVLVTPEKSSSLDLLKGDVKVSSDVIVRNYDVAKTVNAQSLLPYWYGGLATSDQT